MPSGEQANIESDVAQIPPRHRSGVLVEPDNRPLPFVLRCCLTWLPLEEAPGPEDGQLNYWRHAPLTGTVTATERGHDVGFSDLESS